jgi:DNA-binding NarL/FixJ family response regulator
VNLPFEKQGVLPAAQGSGQIGILVVDDHPMTRYGIVQLLQGHPDFVVQGEAGSAAEAIKMIARLSFALAIVDISLPGRNGLELIKDALALRPELKILICSMHDELLYGQRVLRAGARGFIAKGEGGQALLHAVREVLRGRSLISARLADRLTRTAGRLDDYVSRGAMDCLSDRELEVFTLIGRGLRTSEIASVLNLSVKTVETHRTNIREKLSLADGQAVAFYASRWTAENV